MWTNAVVTFIMAPQYVRLLVIVTGWHANSISVANLEVADCATVQIDLHDTRNTKTINS